MTKTKITRTPGSNLVAASVAEINTGTDFSKYITPLGAQGSKYLDQSGSKVSAIAAGTNTYTATINPAITSYENTQVFSIKFTNANTGKATLNLNGLGAKPLLKNGSKELLAGDIAAGQIYGVAYDGTNLQLDGHTSLLSPPVVSGAQSTFVNASSITLGTTGEDSYVRAMTNDFTMKWNGLLTADITVSGAGGLDTGSEAPNTWYAVYVIGDTTGVNTPKALLSASFTSPTLPAGYDKSRRIFAVRNDGSSNIRKFYCQSKDSQRRVFWDSLYTSLRALNNGASLTFATIDLSAYAPPTARTVDFTCNFANIGGTAGDFFLLRPLGSVVTIPSYYGTTGIVLTSGVGTSVAIEMATSNDQKIEYSVSNANDTLTILMQGYTSIL